MGIMIGEILLLNAVAEECKRINRWSFFFSSQPLGIDHGIASPPNAAVCIKIFVFPLLFLTST